MIDLAAVVGLFRQEVPELQVLYLFGSRAEDMAVEGSDVDLALLAARPLEAGQRWQLQEKAAELVGADVDLVDLRSASAVMRVQVLERSQLLYERHPVARAAFEMFALSDYARLNEERKGILEDIRARGTVHG